MGAEREELRERIPSRLHDQPNAGLDLTILRSSLELESRVGTLNPLSLRGEPQCILFNKDLPSKETTLSEPFFESKKGT